LEQCGPGRIVCCLLGVLRKWWLLCRWLLCRWWRRGSGFSWGNVGYIIAVIIFIISVGVFIRRFPSVGESLCLFGSFDEALPPGP
jgi:hypothetical protein